MRIFCTALLLLGTTSIYAQRFDLSVFAGGTWNSPRPTTNYTDPDAGKINALGSVELRCHPVSKLTIGLGLSAEKLSTGLKSFITTDQVPEGTWTVLTCNLGRPALTAYLIAGARFPIGKYIIAPEAIAGYVTTQKATKNSLDQINYGPAIGTMMGLQLSASKAISKKISLGIRTGIKYYVLEHEGDLKQSKTISVPFGIVAGIRL